MKTSETRRRVAITFDPEGGRARPEFQDECDVNQILRKFQKTGLLNHLAHGHPKYGDFTNVQSYGEAVEQVRAAEAAFMQLPANIRRRFDNNPAELVAFMEDSSNAAEAEELGLIPSNNRANDAPEMTETVTTGQTPAETESGPTTGDGTTGDS